MQHGRRGVGVAPLVLPDDGIRAGEIAITDRATLDAVRATVRSKLAVTDPDYALTAEPD